MLSPPLEREEVATVVLVSSVARVLCSFVASALVREWLCKQRVLEDYRPVHRDGGLLASPRWFGQARRAGCLVGLPLLCTCRPHP